MSPEFDKQGEIQPDRILAALDKAVASDSFGKAERPARFLRHLVETTLRGESHLLKESVLGTDVFERPASWDPRLEPIVRQEAARLRKRLAKYYENGGAADEIHIELPVGSYVPVFQRKKPETEIEIPQPPPPVRRRVVWPYAAAGILGIALAAGAWRTVARYEIQPAIAVLPFVNLTANPDNQYFSDGLTDEITDSLARFKTLRVIARSSAFQFKGKTVDIHEVGRLLNVSDVLEGSVARSGDRIKIVAHLERVSDGALIWSNTYERKASDLYAIQSELAAGIAGELKIATGGPSNRHIPNAEAHEFFMKGRYELQQLTPESVTQAELDLQHAIDKDPQYAAAYVGLSSAKYDKAMATGSAHQIDAELQEVESLLRKAIQLEPDMPAAHAELALQYMQYYRDWGKAEQELQLASRGPSSTAVERTYGVFLLYHGRIADADRHFSRMVELDPFSTGSQTNLATIRMLEGRFSEAREIAQKAAAENPKMLWTQQAIAFSYIEQGHPELALPIFRQLEQHYPQAQLGEAMALAKNGRKDEALRLIRPYEEDHSSIPAEWLALVYAFMGDEPNTVKWLQQSADLHETQVLSLAVDPAFAGMRKSPGFQALVKRLGLD